MQRALPVLLVVTSVAVAAAPPARTGRSVVAVVETTLQTAAPQIRQLAFDGNPDTYFASAGNARAADHFTLVFDQPVAVRLVAVRTGRPGGGDRLDAGALEGSADGQQFEPLSRLAEGAARVRLEGRKLRAVRVRPVADLGHPLVVREFTVESDPPVAAFKYPVEILLDVADAPEMKGWAEKTARVCERAYPMINEELRSEGFRPPQLIRMTLRSSYKGVAMAGGGQITGSVDYFKRHPDDVGAMVHETVHIVQRYRTRGNPSWLVEGIADYIRFFKYEPGKLGRINPDRARYNGSYRVTAAFLAYLSEHYDPQIVRKLNQMMREGEYREAAFKQLTGKPLDELDREWRATLRR